MPDFLQHLNVQCMYSTIHSHVFRLCRLVLVARDFRGLLSALVDLQDQVALEFPPRPYFHVVQVHLALRQDLQDLFRYHPVQVK